MNWERTSAQAELYGYEARVWVYGDRWSWKVCRPDNGKVLATGSTKRETSARAAARRWILAQPDAQAAHKVATMGHWNGRPFDGSAHWSSHRNADWSDSLVGACGAKAGWSTNYVSERAKINCDDCLKRIASAEAAPAPVHSRDADCDVDPETDCCRVCGVLHGDPCPRCAGRAFHDEGAHP